MKKSIFFISFLLSILAGNNALADWYQAVAKPNLVVRAAPDVTGQKLGTVPYGGKVNVVKRVGREESIGGRTGHWVKIHWKNKTAYVFDAFLVKMEAEEKHWYRSIARPSLVVRKAPDVTGTQMGNVPYGGKVQVLKTVSKRESIGGRSGHWVKILWKNKTGYVFDAFLEPLD